MSGTAGGPTKGTRVPEADVVHLSLNHEGIWHVPAAAAETTFTRTPHRRTAAPSRLAPIGNQPYAPTGRLQACPTTPGLMLDLYA
jgi:hypothetical protein